MNEHLASLIAAGEVVERPLSIVKELVENSIDAEADEIKIELLDSGMQLLRVVDNGHGMNRDDVERSILRHASSKILQESDLQNIQTLGFRGEALAAIAAVSKLTIFSCDGQDSTKLEVAGGVVTNLESTAFREGTIVEVRSLFYNTPARLKHIVNLYTEIGKITDFLTKLSLAYPTISFTLTNDDKVILNTSKTNNPLKTISEVYGTNTAKLMDFLQFGNHSYQLEMYLSKTQMQRASRKYINVFVNGRYIQSDLITRALIKVYHNYIPSSRYPIIIVNIKCDPSLVDVNIHPHKLEVKFSMHQELKDLITSEVSRHLASYTHEVKVFSDYDDKVTFDQLFLERESVVADKAELVYEERENSNKTFADEKRDLEKFCNIIGQLYGTYVLAQNEENFYIIDQHAAQERINYEKLQRAFQATEVFTTELLVPVVLEYPLHEYEKLVSQLERVAAMGFGIEAFGVNSFIIREVPTWVTKDFEEEVISLILEKILNGEKVVLLEIVDDIIEIMSCRQSIKANDRLSILEMEKLIDDLFGCEDPYHCPHKRPTIISYSRKGLEKLFMRIM